MSDNTTTTVSPSQTTTEVPVPSDCAPMVCRGCKKAKSIEEFKPLLPLEQLKKKSDQAKGLKLYKTCKECRRYSHNYFSRLRQGLPGRDPEYKRQPCPRVKTAPPKPTRKSVFSEVFGRHGITDVDAFLKELDASLVSAGMHRMFEEHKTYRKKKKDSPETPDGDKQDEDDGQMEPTETQV